MISNIKDIKPFLDNLQVGDEKDCYINGNYVIYDSTSSADILNQYNAACNTMKKHYKKHVPYFSFSPVTIIDPYNVAYKTLKKADVHIYEVYYKETIKKYDPIEKILHIKYMNTDSFSLPISSYEFDGIDIDVANGLLQFVEDFIKKDIVEFTSGTFYYR